MMRVLGKIAVVLCISACVTAGCMSVEEAQAQNAVLVSDNDVQQAQLASVIGQWFGGVDITLASDAFVNESTVTIERQPFSDGRGLPIEGRHNNPSHSFTLLRLKATCKLRYNEKGETVDVPTIDCVAHAH